jgi:hypothetical protein
LSRTSSAMLTRNAPVAHNAAAQAIARPTVPARGDNANQVRQSEDIVSGRVWSVHWRPSHQRWLAGSLGSGYHPGGGVGASVISCCASSRQEASAAAHQPREFKGSSWLTRSRPRLDQVGCYPFSRILGSVEPSPTVGFLREGPAQ